MTQLSSVYIHQKSESFRSRFLQGFMGLINAKSGLRKNLAKGDIKNDPVPMPKSFRNKYNVNIQDFKGRKLWTFGPKNNASEQVIFYAPGGAYMFSIVALHWSFLEKIVDATDVTVVIANYPVAPQATANESHEYMTELYRKVLSEYKGKEVIIMGDSAGGGLSIAFVQTLSSNGLPQPKQIIALSPFLDITMSNPNISKMEKQDKVLEPDSLREAGKLYAGNISDKDPRVSPIYGSFNDLGKLSIFMGTNDVFIADARKLTKKLEQKQIPFNYFEYPRMMHTWMLSPVALKEGNVAIKQIIDLIKN